MGTAIFDAVTLPFRLGKILANCFDRQALNGQAVGAT
jgi:hypothetical protein